MKLKAVGRLVGAAAVLLPNARFYRSEVCKKGNFFCLVFILTFTFLCELILYVSSPFIPEIQWKESLVPRV